MKSRASEGRAQARLRAMLSVDEIMQIFRSLICVFFCGDSCIEDISTHLMYNLSSHPKLKTCSADTILCAIKELTVDNTIYTSLASGRSYDFNIADKMNDLLVKSLLATGGLRSGQECDLDFDHQFIQTEKYDAKWTYKKFFCYSPGVAVIGNNIVGIENHDGNANVRFCQQHTLERIFDEMNNGFGWKRLPKSFMSENTVYLLITALVRNFYKTIIQKINAKDFGLFVTSRVVSKLLFSNTFPLLPNGSKHPEPTDSISTLKILLMQGPSIRATTNP